MIRKWIHKRGLRRLWRRYGAHVRKHAETYNIPAELLLAVAWRESRGKERAYREEPRLKDASYGLCQILCSTARDLGFQGECHKLFDPDLNLRLGAKYLAFLLGVFRFNQLLAVAAYNAGPARVYKLWSQSEDVRAFYSRLPRITRDYLREVFGPDLDGKGGTLELAREVINEGV